MNITMIGRWTSIDFLMVYHVRIINKKFVVKSDVPNFARNVHINQSIVLILLILLGILLNVFKDVSEMCEANLTQIVTA